MSQLSRVECPRCQRLLFKARGAGTEIEIRCKCGRLVAIDRNSVARVVDDGGRQTAKRAA